jgi:hypothetical protein
MLVRELIAILETMPQNLIVVRSNETSYQAHLPLTFDSVGTSWVIMAKHPFGWEEFECYRRPINEKDQPELKRRKVLFI